MRSPSANALLFMPASPLPANLLQKQNLCGSPVNACGKSARSFVGMWRIWRVFARGADTALTTPIPPLSKKSLPKQIFFGRGKGVGLPSSLTQAKGLPQKSRWRVLRDKKMQGLAVLASPCFHILYHRINIYSAQYIPSMPPPAGAGAAGGVGISVTMDSVVRSVEATEAAFWSTERVTLVGSMMPLSSISV